MNLSDHAPDRLQPPRDMERLLLQPWLAGLSRHAIQDLAAISIHRQYQAHDMVRDPDGREAAVMVVLSGALRLYGLSNRGREVTLEQVHAPTVFGLWFVNPEFPSSYLVSAQEDDTVVLHLDYDTYFAWLERHPRAAVAALRLVGFRLSAARERLADFALYDLRSRLAHTVAQLALRNGPFVRMKHEELASLVGARQEEVTRTLRYFREQGLIEYKPHQRGFRVIDILPLAHFGADSR
ncbi:MAG TPA: Crp/Fnr family transcriptional regulator [Chloroflexota bacterium]